MAADPDARTAPRRRIQALHRAAEALQKALPGRHRLTIGFEHGSMAVLAALLAYWAAEAMGLPQSYWGAVAAIAVLQPEYKATRTTARDQFAGALVGGVIALLVALALGQHLWAYGLAVMGAIALCWALNIGSAARLSGTTATIIMLVPHEGSPILIMLSRLGEVAWGVSVALAVVWLASRLGLAGDRAPA